MKPVYENISPDPGTSFYISVTSPGCCEPYWHIHPEYELVFIKSGSAERHIGHNVSRYFDGDLLLIGSNVPHSNLGNIEQIDNIEVVIQMNVDFVDKQIASFPEFKNINKLFKRSLNGISFGKKTKEMVAEKLINIHNQNTFNRLITLFEVLQVLAKCKDYELLNQQDATIEIQSNDYARINIVNEYISKNYNHNLQLEEMSELTGLTPTSFSRFFKKVTGKSFITFLNEYRIQKACSFLADKNTSIAEIMYNVGFSEPAHFTRTFKKYTNHTPREYRRKIRFW